MIRTLFGWNSESKIMLAALAGLIHDLGLFARRAGDHSWNIEQIVPNRWQGKTKTSLINLARQLASGTEVDQKVDPKQRLSIFCSLNGLTQQGEEGEKIQPPVGKYIPLKKLQISRDALFPVGKLAETQTAYQTLWSSFLAEAKKLKSVHDVKGSDLASYLETLLNLLKMYAWAVPTHEEDVSLYDHSRMTAALAACLVLQNGSKVDKDNDAVALLVGGDISGVQSFIYTITSQGAASGLRGRSMYLQLLTEVLLRHVLDELGLPITNLIYAGGGGFYLLVPPTAGETLEALRKKINRILLHQHGGDLYLALAWHEVRRAEFAGGKFAKSWDQLQKTLQKVKQRKFAELGAEGLTDLFGLNDHEKGGGEEIFCVVCHREHQHTVVKNGVRKCPSCLQFEELGKDLREADYMCIDRLEPTDPPNKADQAGTYQDVLHNFGYRVYFSDLCAGL